MLFLGSAGGVGLKRMRKTAAGPCPAHSSPCEPTQSPTCRGLAKIKVVAQSGRENSTFFENQASNLCSALIISRCLAYNSDVALSFGAGFQPSPSWPGPGILLSQLSLAHNLLPNYETSYLPPVQVFVNSAFLRMVSGPRSSSAIRNMILPTSKLKVPIIS